ncbi:hypothetical protein O3G_MSEX005397 [Manduca sexta]|uniref:Choline/carnitine acyltransferase domain-containing protein n=1 Tax=Manduca sexta TaxID=7130 RepID=A0A921YZE5_MANSE|nr:hypothetical protein O3G_MSEX005397 [Manduca sexta]
MKIILVIIIIVQSEALMPVIPKNDSPVLMKLLQSVDSATNDEHLFEVALKLLKSLCVCMRETLRQKEEKVIFNGDNNSLEADDLATDSRDLEIYGKIYNNTCFDLRQELAHKINSIQNITIDNEALNDYVNCGSNKKNITDNAKIITKIGAKLELQNILYKVLIETKDLHNYSIRRYNLFGKAKPHIRSNLKHSIIVILTLRPLSRKNENAQEVNGKELHEILNQKSSIDIDIIDAKYDPNDRASEEYVKENIVSDCNLRSVYTFLIESEKKKLTKVFKLLRRNGTIKVYIDVTTRSNHTDFSRICCNNDTSTPLCKTDFINSNLETEEFFGIAKTQSNIKTGNYKDTISKIKDLVKLYDKKLEAVAKGVLDKTRLESAKDSGCLGTSNMDAQIYEIPESIRRYVTRASTNLTNTVLPALKNITLVDKTQTIGIRKHGLNNKLKHDKSIGIINILTSPITENFVIPTIIDSKTQVLDNRQMQQISDKMTKSISTKDLNNQYAESNTVKDMIIKFYKTEAELKPSHVNDIKGHEHITFTDSCINCISKDSQTWTIQSPDVFTNSLISTTAPKKYATRYYYDTALQTPHTEADKTLGFKNITDKVTQKVPVKIPESTDPTMFSMITNTKSIHNENIIHIDVKSNVTIFDTTQESLHAIIAKPNIVTPDYKVRNELEKQTKYPMMISSVFPLTPSYSSIKVNLSNISTTITKNISTSARETVKYLGMLKSDVGLNNITTEATTISYSRIPTSDVISNFRKPLNVTSIEYNTRPLITPNSNINREDNKNDYISESDKLITTSKRFTNFKNSYTVNNTLIPSNVTIAVRVETPIKFSRNTHHMQKDEDILSKLNGFTIAATGKFKLSKDIEHVTPSSIYKNIMFGTTDNLIKPQQDMTEEYDRVIIPIRQVIKKYKSKPIIIDNLFLQEESNKISTRRKAEYKVKMNSSAITIKSFDGLAALKTIPNAFLPFSNENITAVNKTTSCLGTFKEITEARNIDNTTKTYTSNQKVSDYDLNSNKTELKFTLPIRKYTSSKTSFTLPALTTPPISEVNPKNLESREKRQTNEIQNGETSTEATVTNTFNFDFLADTNEEHINIISKDKKLKTFSPIPSLLTSQHFFTTNEKNHINQNKQMVQLFKQNETKVNKNNDHSTRNIEELTEATKTYNIKSYNKDKFRNITMMNILTEPSLSTTYNGTDKAYNPTYAPIVNPNKTTKLINISIENDVAEKNTIMHDEKVNINISQSLSILNNNRRTNQIDSITTKSEVNSLNNTLQDNQNIGGANKRESYTSNAKLINGLKTIINFNEIDSASNKTTKIVPKPYLRFLSARKEKTITKKPLDVKENLDTETIKTLPVYKVKENKNKTKDLSIRKRLDSVMKGHIVLLAKVQSTTEALKFNETFSETKNEKAFTNNTKEDLKMNVIENITMLTPNNIFINSKWNSTFTFKKNITKLNKNIYSTKILNDYKTTEIINKNQTYVQKKEIHNFNDNDTKRINHNTSSTKQIKYYPTEYGVHNITDIATILNKSTPNNYKQLITLSYNPLINEVLTKTQKSLMRMTTIISEYNIPTEVRDGKNITPEIVIFNKLRSNITANVTVTCVHNVNIQLNTTKHPQNLAYFNDDINAIDKKTTNAFHASYRGLSLTNSSFISNDTYAKKLKETKGPKTITVSRGEMFLENPTLLKNMEKLTTDIFFNSKVIGRLSRQIMSTSPIDNIKETTSKITFSDKWRDTYSLPQSEVATTVMTAKASDKTINFKNKSSPKTTVMNRNTDVKDAKIPIISSHTPSTQSGDIVTSNEKKAISTTNNIIEIISLKQPINNNKLSPKVTTYIDDKPRSLHIENTTYKIDNKMTSWIDALKIRIGLLKEYLTIPTVTETNIYNNFTHVNNKNLLYSKQLEKENETNSEKTSLFKSLPVMLRPFSKFPKHHVPTTITYFTKNNNETTQPLYQNKREAHTTKKEMSSMSLDNENLTDIQNIISITENYGLINSGKTANDKTEYYFTQRFPSTTMKALKITKLFKPSASTISSNETAIIDTSDVSDVSDDIINTAEQKSIQNIRTMTTSMKMSSIPTQRKIKVVTSWWLDDMYLKVRLPLPINSNPGMVFPRRKFAKMEEVADLGALFIDDLLDYKEMLDRGELPLERATSREKGQPLCMEQFYRLLGVCRIPEMGRDRLDLPKIKNGTEEQEELVVVACRNYFYPIPVKAMDRGRLTPGEIQAQILHAMVDASAAPPAPRVGLLTSMNRDQWARAREQLIRDENNRSNLELISRALCILCVDEAGGDRADTDEQTNAMLRAMHGAGTRHHSANRWFDKTVQLIISSDGTVGMCYEHSAAEGVAVIRLAERALARAEVADRPAPPPALLPAPQAMKWNITGDVQRTIEQAARDLDRAISDLDFKVYTYRGYGREFMKSCKTSPDVYIQLALQYAYYKMYGYLVTTYESASLRRFRNGRVDNIRSAHNGAHAWAAAMCTAETPPLNEANDDGQKKVSFNLYGEQKKLELFEEAARKQTSIMEANILGRGIDNHLLGLREAARESMGALPPLFNDDTYKQMIHFKLSTSQVATTTEGTFMGYGAVVPDGYGCSYNPKKDCVIFCISSFTSSSVTNTEAFRQSLEEALDSMKLMFQARKVEN